MPYDLFFYLNKVEYHVFIHINLDDKCPLCMTPKYKMAGYNTNYFIALIFENEYYEDAQEGDITK